MPLILSSNVIWHVYRYILPHTYSYLYITSYILKKETLCLVSVAFSKCGNKYQKIFKEEGSIKMLILGLITNIEEHQKLYNHD